MNYKAYMGNRSEMIKDIKKSNRTIMGTLESLSYEDLQTLAELHVRIYQLYKNYLAYSRCK